MVGRLEFAHFTLPDVTAAYDRAQLVFTARREASVVLEQQAGKGREEETELKAQIQAVRDTAAKAREQAKREEWNGGGGEEDEGAAQQRVSDNARDEDEALKKQLAELQAKLEVVHYDFVRVVAELDLMKALEPTLLLRRDFVHVFTDFGDLKDGCVKQLSLKTFKYVTFAPCVLGVAFVLQTNGACACTSPRLCCCAC